MSSAFVQSDYGKDSKFYIESPPKQVTLQAQHKEGKGRGLLEDTMGLIYLLDCPSLDFGVNMLSMVKSDKDGRMKLISPLRFR